MENVLDIYQRPYESKNPWLCFDESCKQLVKETREPIQAEPGKLERYDYQYERNGVANLFMFFEPLTGWRHVRPLAKVFCATIKGFLLINFFLEKNNNFPIFGINWIKAHG